MNTQELKESEFYIANYGTDENIEIFKNYYEAKAESVDEEVYICELNEELVYFEEDIQRWNYEDKSDLFLTTPEIATLPTLTDDNIHLYYKFMSDEKKKENKHIIAPIIWKRRDEIAFKLNKDIGIFNIPTQKNPSSQAMEVFVHLEKKVDDITLTCFGVKDTLKPLDEYIAEIKQSPAYQEYKNQNPSQASLQDIQTDPELETPGGFSQAKEDLDQRVAGHNPQRNLQ